MVLNNIYIVPHGDELIDLPNEESRIMSNHIREVAKNENADVILIISPHGITLRNSIAVINTENFYSNTKLKGLTVDFTAKNERELTESIINEIPDLCEELRFSTYSGELSTFPLDFGTSIPLYFFKQRRIVVIGQPRIDDRKRLFEFGESLFSIVNKYKSNVSIIFSADQAHTHSKNGPYGYSPLAKKYEDFVIGALKEGKMEVMRDIPKEFIESGKPDSYWNLLILSGLLKSSGKKMEYVYNYVQVYFGMMLARSV